MFTNRKRIDYELLAADVRDWSPKRTAGRLGWTTKMARMRHRLIRLIAHTALSLLAVAAGQTDARAQGKSYTWVGADGGSWNIASNWDDGSGQSTGSPGDTDFAQFVSFNGKVTGALAAQFLFVGPGSSLTFGGSGFFSQITVGQDANANVGAASITISAGNVVSATLLNLGSVLGGNGTLIAAGIFSTSGGIIMDQTGLAGTIIAQNGGQIFDGASLTMPAGGTVQIGSSGQMVIGSASGGGTNGALTINSCFALSGEGTIAGNVIVNGKVETFNAGLPANTLTITGNVAGTGQVNVVQEMDINGAIGSGVAITLASNGGANKGLLQLLQPAQDQGALGTMSTTSTIRLSGLNFNQASWAPGFLTVSGASGTLALPTSGDHAFQSFTASPNGMGGTDIVVGLSSSFTDDPLVAGATTIKAVHITELRLRIDTARGTGGLAAFAWSRTITQLATTVAAIDVSELHTALSQAYVASGRGTPAFTAPPAAAGAAILASQIQEIRTFLKAAGW